MLDDRIPNAVTISIPRNWTTAQADAVFDFLCRLEEAVFIAYERHFCMAELESAAKNLPSDKNSDPEDDCIPF